MASPSVEIVGRVEHIGQIQSSKTSDYTWRDVSIKHGSDKYPEYSKITLKKDKTSLIDPFPIGSMVNAFCFVGGTKYIKKGTTQVNYFNNLTCTYIKAVEGDPGQPPAATAQEHDQQKMEDDDDLPF